MDYNSLTHKQQSAFDMMVRPQKQVTRVIGYAGSGKSTVLGAVARELYGQRVVILTPTNKAAIVLRDKGVPQCMTIHKCLYTPAEIKTAKKDKNDEIIYLKDKDGEIVTDKNDNPVPETNDELTFSLRFNGGKKFPMAIIDEASMVGQKIFDDLLECFEKVVLVGDGFQLPPVKDRDILNEEEPDIFLDEVHRAAQDNPVIRYATDIREGNEPDLADIKCHEINFCKEDNKYLYNSIIEHEVQTICWSNKQRHFVNRKIREATGYQLHTLCEGERIVCNENVWVGFGEDRYLRFYNGQILEVAGDYDEMPDSFKPTAIDVAGEQGSFSLWPFWNPGFNDIDFRIWKNECDRRRARQEYRHGHKADYAYCLTAHKSQGSEFKNVGVFDERWKMRRSSNEEKQRWFYTAITRAKERILIIR